MRLQLAKEVRALLPAWLTAVLLVAGIPIVVTILPGEWVGDTVKDHFIAPGFLAALHSIGCIIVSVSAFGHEFHYGTVRLLLTQPHSRSRLWWEKMFPLAIALGVLTGLFCEVNVWGLSKDELPRFLAFAVVMPIVFYGSGPLWTLLLRHSQAAFWFTPVAPAIVASFAVTYIAGRASPGILFWSVTGVIYGALTLALARVVWQYLQDVESIFNRAAVLLPLARENSSQFGFGQRERLRGVSSQLVWKEVGLQQGSLALAGVLVVLEVTLYLAGGPEGDSRESLRDLLRMAYFVIPFAIGATAIAEERGLGLLAWHQTLPVSRCHQFRVKVGTVVGLALLLGGLLPATKDLLLGRAISEIDLIGTLSGIKEVLVIFIGIPLLGVGLGLYGSSLGVNFLTGLFSAIFAMAGVFLVLWAVGIMSGSNLLFPSYVDAEPHYLGILVLTVSAVYLGGFLSYYNFKQNLLNRGFFWRNGVFALGGLVALLMLASLLHRRAWEWVEIAAYPEPGPALTEKVEPEAEVNREMAIFLTSDGRIWEWKGRQTLNQVGNDSDWKDVSLGSTFSTASHVLAVKQDGSLWAWGANGRGQLGIGDRQSRQVPTRVAEKADWKEAEAADGYSLGLTVDGSLWLWGSHSSWQPERNKENEDGEALTLVRPHRISRESQWTKGVAFAEDGAVLALRGDGSLWLWQYKRCDTPSDSLFRAVRLDESTGTSYSVWKRSLHFQSIHQRMRGYLPRRPVSP